MHFRIPTIFTDRKYFLARTMVSKNTLTHNPKGFIHVLSYKKGKQNNNATLQFCNRALQPGTW